MWLELNNLSNILFEVVILCIKPKLLCAFNTILSIPNPKITEEIIKLTLERAILEDFYYDDILNQYEYFSELSCLECNGKFVATIKFIQK